MSKADAINIRSLQQIEELEDTRKLESKIWGEADSIPTHQTITAVKNGGLVLGAFDGFPMPKPRHSCLVWRQA